MPESMNTRKLLLTLLKLVLTAVILYFLIQQVMRHWPAISEYSWNVHYGYLGLSILLAQVSFLLQAQGWRLIIREFGHSVTLAEAFKISYLSNLGRYIPGKVWQVFGILYLTSQKGIPAETSGASFVLWQMFSIPAAFLAFVISARIEPSIIIDRIAFIGETSTWLMTGGVIVLCAVLILYPSPFLSLINALLRYFKRPAIEFKMDKSIALQIFTVYFVIWIVLGLAFWLFLHAVSGYWEPGPIEAIGIFSIAYQIGYLVLFAPGGFGPREAVLAALLVPFFGPLSLLIAGLARLWSIVVEVIAALVALRIKL